MSTYLPFVGFVRFPRNPSDLTPQVCPACLIDRVGSVCGACGLNLDSPLMAQLDSSSMDAAAALDRRLELIGRIRHDSAEALALTQPSSPVTSAAVARPAPTVPPMTSRRVTPLATVTPPTAVAAPRRHLGVQVILLVVGVSLLSIGAIFFLVYTFITFGLVWRSVIIVAVTIAAIVGASLLKRRRLRATAEAISALGAVFVYLDIFAVKANELFGTGDANDQLYWGIALLLSAIGFTVWHRYSGLRLPNVIAFVTFAPGLALLVGGATDGLDESMRVFSSFVALAVGGFTHPLGRYRVEKVLVTVLGIAGLILAALMSTILTGDDWAPALGLGIVAIVAMGHTWMIARVGYPVSAGRITAAIGAAAAASATFFVALRVEESGFSAFWPVVVAAIVALLLELLARRQAPGLNASFARIAAWTAGGIGIALLVTPLINAITPSIALASAASPRWISSGGSRVVIQPENAAALLALLVVVVLVGAAWALSGTLDQRLLVVVAAGCATLLLAVPLVGVLWAVVVAWLLVAVAGLVALAFARAYNASAGIRIILACTSLAAMALAYFSSWASIDTWWYGSVGVVVILVASRAVTTAEKIRASTLGVASILAFIAVGAEGYHINERFAAGVGAWTEATHTVAILAAAVLAASALLARRLSSRETRVLFWISLTVATATAAISWLSGSESTIEQLDALVLPYRATTTLLALGMLIALGLWTVLRSTAIFDRERMAASVLIAPAAAWTLDSLARATQLPVFVTAVAPMVAALVVGASALAVAAVTPARRLPLDVGVAVVAVPTAVVSVVSDATWLVFVIGAVTALLLAVSRDGLFSSSAPRKHFGWIALALGAGGLWWALADASIGAIEPYVLPLAGALLLIALLDWRSARSRSMTTTVAPFVVLAGLLIAIVPIAITAMTGPSVRTVIVAVACAALLLIASLTIRPGPLRPYLDTAAIASAAGLIIAGFGRPSVIALASRRDDLQLDAWVATTFVALIATAVIQARAAEDNSRARRREIAEAVLAMAIGGVVVIEFSVLNIDVIGTVRAVTVLVVLAAIHVASLLVDRAPFTGIIGWVALGGAAITGIIAIGVKVIDPLEWANVIIAVALLTVGALRLRRNPSLGSWPGLAPGILVLVIPSLLATYTDAPIWRLVGLGAVCIVAILVGTLAQLQAPLIIGAVVVLIHAIRTFAPNIVAVYQLTEWWVWAVVGGGIILFLAVTLEKRVRDLKAVGSRVSSLR